MSSNISGTILTYVNVANVISSVSGATTTDAAKLGQPGITFTGTGSGDFQLNGQFYYSETLNGTRTWDLTNLPAATGTLTLAQVKALVIWSGSTTDGSGYDIVVGNAGSNPWYSFVSASTTTTSVSPGGILVLVSPLATPSWTVNSSNKNLLLTTANAVPYTIFLAGC